MILCCGLKLLRRVYVPLSVNAAALLQEGGVAFPEENQI